MIWILFAVLAYFIWAFSVVVDKVLRTKYMKNSISLTASFGIYGIIFSLIMFLFIGVPSIPLWNFFAALFAGFILPLIVIPYVKAISFEEVSRVTPLWMATPIFTLIFAVIFLNEVLSPLNYAAFLFLLLGGFFISTRRVKSVFHVSSAVGLMMLSSFSASISEVLLKFAYASSAYWPTFLIFYFGATLGYLSLFLFKKVRKNFSVKDFNKRNFYLILFFSVLTGTIGHLFYSGAILLGPVTLVSVFVAFQSLFVLLLSNFLSYKFPNLIKEEVNVKIIGLKVFAISLMAIGLFLLTF